MTDVQKRSFIVCCCRGIDAATLCPLLCFGKRGAATILVCDTTGDSVSPALVALAKLLLERVRLSVLFLVMFRPPHACLCDVSCLVGQVRYKTTIQQCAVARPSVRVCLSFLKGLEEMESTMDQKRLDRLGVRLRHSDMLNRMF